MEYQTIINLLDNTPNQPSQFRTSNWAEINDKLRGTYSTSIQTKFKTTMLKSRLCDYSDGYILVKGMEMKEQEMKKKDEQRSMQTK